MAREYPKRRKDPEVKIEGTKSFSLGLSQLGHPSVIKPNELAEAQNVMYTLNGVIEKRPGSQMIGDIRGTSTTLNVGTAVYDIGGSDYFLRISDDGILQRYVWASDLWVDISGSPTFSDTKTAILQAWGTVYILNDTDNFTSWNGTTFTTKVAIADPTVIPVLAKVGTGTGSRQLAYTYAWQNDAGNTLATASVKITGLPEKLDATTYVTITVPTAPATATKTMIFRGGALGDERYLDCMDKDILVYTDRDYVSVDNAFGVPSNNSTGGFHFKDRIATVYNGSIIGITTEMGDDCLVSSGVAENIGQFGRADGGEYFYWRKDDGYPITGIHEYQESLYTFKTDKVGSFKFSLTGGTMTLVSLASGAVSQDSIHAAGNDLRYWSKEGAMSLGNEANYAGIRTKILSARADTLVGNINQADLSSICGIFYKSHSLWGLPQGLTGSGNTTVIAYNERFSAWSEWFGLKPKQFMKVIDPDNKERLFMSAADSANIKELWTGRDDCGDTINWRVSTKQFDAGVSYKYKTYNRVFFVFGNVTGGSTRVVLTENGFTKQAPLALYASNVGNQGFGVDMWGDVEFGSSSGEADEDASGLNIRFANVGYKDLFSLQATFTNNGLLDNLQLMGMFIEYSDSSLPLPSEFELQLAYD